MKAPSMSGFVGHHGEPIWLEHSQQHEDDSPLVLARPDLFEDVPSGVVDDPAESFGLTADTIPPKRGPGRPKGSVRKPDAVD